MNDPNVNVESIEASLEKDSLSLTIKCKLLFPHSSKENPVDIEIKAKEKKKEKEEKKERRVDIDLMDDPPISSLIASDLSRCVEELKKNQTGHELNCLVVGKYTSNWACVVADSLPVAGGRVLCIGDCISNGQPDDNWMDTVGSRFGNNVFPVTGDAEDNFQGIDKPFDLVLISECGSYADIATRISRWMGLLQSGGVICGTQLDEEDYPASFGAITDLFGEKVMSSEKSSFWSVRTEADDAKK